MVHIREFAVALFSFLAICSLGIRAEVAQPAPDPVPADIAKLITDFQSTNPDVNNKAFMAVVNKGGPAYKPLALLRKSQNKELAMRADHACKAIESKARSLMIASRKLNFEMTSTNLTVANLKRVKESFEQLGTYTPFPGLDKNALSFAQQLEQQINTVQEATDALAVLDGKCNLKPIPQGVVLAAIQVDRADRLLTLKRYPEAIAAADEGLKLELAKNRFASRLLMAKARALFSIQKRRMEAEAVCRQLLADCPNCFERKQAHQMLIQMFEADEDRVEDLLKELKAYYQACKLDEDAQKKLLDSLDVFYEIDPRYERAAELAEFMFMEWPPSRLPSSVVVAYSRCNEYVLKNFKNAEKGYGALLTLFPDEVNEDLMKAALERLGKKTAGTFPKGLDAADKGPEGVFAKWIAALAKQDYDKLEEYTLEDDFDFLDLRIEEIMQEVVLSDYTVEKCDIDAKAGKAKLHVRHFIPAILEPRQEIIELRMEGEAWRVHWPDPDFDGEDEGDADGGSKAGGFTTPQNMPKAATKPGKPPEQEEAQPAKENK